jgi:hypothetical protein
MAGAVYRNGRRNTLEYKTWSKWLDAADALTKRYCRAMEDDDPFAYNETASVSILTAAAACTGYIGLADFSTKKASRENRAHGPGRSDFWMQAEGRSWAFEFKQWMPVTAPHKRLVSYMAAAEGCAKKIVKGPSDGVIAGLIVPLYWIDKGKRNTSENVLQRARTNLEAFAGECDFAWTLGGSRETWLLFNVVRKWW